MDHTQHLDTQLCANGNGVIITDRAYPEMTHFDSPHHYISNDIFDIAVTREMAQYYQFKCNQCTGNDVNGEWSYFTIEFPCRGLLASHACRSPYDIFGNPSLCMSPLFKTEIFMQSNHSNLQKVVMIHYN